MINLDSSNRPDAKRSLSLSILFQDFIYLEGLARAQGSSLNKLVKRAIQESLKREVVGYITPEV
ncbi:MAG: hypothetical protein MRK02_06905 [Candidatus Scalindua sp.]|nr:hypothetical protein [Candidatus Scalindua sp.]